MTAATETAVGSAPAEGQLVTVRNRVWVVSDVVRSAIAPQSMTGRPQHAVTLVRKTGSTPRAAAQDAPALEDGTLFPPPDTLF
jgi:hypothetical protein